MRITILWSCLASYSVALFKELALQGLKIQLIYQPNASEGPYQPFDLSFCEAALEDSDRVKINLESIINDFQPSCILMSSWNFHHFMRLTKKVRKNGIYVISTIDHQWHGTFKQYIGVISSRIFLKPSIDKFLVAGDRQADFACKLGYNDVLYGLYAADINNFICDLPIWQRAANFLFLGRLVAVKGIEELAGAYLAYRGQVKKPWGLKVAGTGPLAELLRDIPGVELLGFVQPHLLAELMHESRCLLLPSRWEPWGVVIHEAAAAGLPIIATYHCGATTMFVRDGENGYVIPPQQRHLAKAMVRISAAPKAVLDHMSTTSSTLAKLWSPDKLAKYFIEEIIAKNSITQD